MSNLERLNNSRKKSTHIKEMAIGCLVLMFGFPTCGLLLVIVGAIGFSEVVIITLFINLGFLCAILLWRTSKFWLPYIRGWQMPAFPTSLRTLFTNQNERSLAMFGLLCFISAFPILFYVALFSLFWGS